MRSGPPLNTFIVRLYLLPVLPPSSGLSFFYRNSPSDSRVGKKLL